MKKKEPPYFLSPVAMQFTVSAFVSTKCPSVVIYQYSTNILMPPSSHSRLLLCFPLYPSTCQYLKLYPILINLFVCCPSPSLQGKLPEKRKFIFNILSRIVPVVWNYSINIYHWMNQLISCFYLLSEMAFGLKQIWKKFVKREFQPKEV